MTIKLSESMPVGCLVSPLDHEDILAQEKRLEELTAAHGQAIAALAAYRAEVKSLNIVIGNLQNQVALYACQPKLHDTDTLMKENATLKTQAEVLYRDNVTLSETADALRARVEALEAAGGVMAEAFDACAASYDSEGNEGPDSDDLAQELHDRFGLFRQALRGEGK